MSEERWDVPSPRLAAIAEAVSSPQFRECPSCRHRHPRGEACGYPSELSGVACRCKG